MRRHSTLTSPPTPPVSRHRACALRWAVMLAAASVGCRTAQPPAPEPTSRRAVKLAPSGEIFNVPITGTPCRGPEDALVTIVEFTDFECAHCAKTQEILAILEERHRGELRVCFRHRTIPLHFFSRDAAEAAEAARLQGRFWEMHDILFANQGALGPSDLQRYARWSGLDLKRFDRDRLSEAAYERVDRDEALAAELQVRAAPTFFVNGRRLRGARPLEVFERYVEEGINDAEQALAAGVPRAALYTTLVDRAPGDEAEGEVHLLVAEVPIAPEDPCRGSTDAPVTIVEFTDFECPFCGRAKLTVDRLEGRFGNQVRLCIKLNPMPYHPHGRSTAILALAAHRQGRFFDFYDDLFDHQEALDDISVLVRARAMDIDMDRLERDAEDVQIRAQLERHTAEAREARLRGTPSFIINEEVIVGAQPYEVFEAAVERQLRARDARGR